MRRTNWIAVGIAVFALLAAAYAVWEPYTVRQDAAAVQSQAKTLADQIAEACAKGGPVAAELGPACAKAAEVKEQPPVAEQSAPDPDPAALRQAARTAVVEYCATRNGCRGSDGSTPNFDSIVTAVVARIPPPKNGADGENGQHGQNATTSQVASAVAAYCGQPDEPCRGRDGKDGRDGESPPCLAEAAQCRGADGQPPTSWTTENADGSTETCRRAGDFDSANPRYECTTSPPPDDPDPLPNPGGT